MNEKFFDDDEENEEFMKEVYKKELGSSFEKVEDGVGIGKTKEKELTKDEAFNAIVEGMKIMGWDKKEERPPPRPLINTPTQQILSTLETLTDLLKTLEEKINVLERDAHWRNN